MIILIVYICINNSFVLKLHVTSSTRADAETVHVEDLEMRKEAYGICGECYEPGTGWHWCKDCNAKRFKDNFKNWTSENQNIDELIQQSQLMAVHYTKCLELIPFEDFQDIVASGKIYLANWPKGYIKQWDIINQSWKRSSNIKVVLKNFNINSDLLNEVIKINKL